jgi:hypothetical protein
MKGLNGWKPGILMRSQSRNSRSRFLNIVLGLGTANCCTLFSITGQLERFSEISYFDDRGFFACFVVALMLFACLPAFKVPLFRLVATSFSLLLIVI